MKDLVVAFYMTMALIVLIVALLGCAPTMSPQERAATEVKGLSTELPEEHVLTIYGLRRVVDKEAGVVCYMYIGRGGVSCLPLSETTLDEGR